MPKPGGTTARGYGQAHVNIRKQWAAKVKAGLCTCTRCGMPVLPHHAWHLDHSDDRTHYLGAAHAYCNKKAGAKLGAQRRWGKRRLAAITANRW